MAIRKVLEGCVQGEANAILVPFSVIYVEDTESVVGGTMPLPRGGSTSEGLGTSPPKGNGAGNSFNKTAVFGKFETVEIQPW